MPNRESAFAPPGTEERLIPIIRARLAKNLFQQDFRVIEIARALKVTPPAVTQYLGERRGLSQEFADIDGLIDPLTEKLAKRMRSGLTIETAELFETARQIIVMNSGKASISRSVHEPRLNRLLGLLRTRLKLELDAAEKYLEFANRTSDDYTKLLLRMIAADSIRHGDVVSQLKSWLEAGGKSEGSVPDQALLEDMLSIEDSASEKSLTADLRVNHPVARLLLQWIDIDEGKHEKMVHGLMALREHHRNVK